MTGAPFLVADVGGTFSRLALAHGRAVEAATIARFRNAEAGSFGEIVAGYLRAQGAPACAACCVALAGPVSGDRGRMTNLDWEIDLAGLRAASGAPRAAILNDLQALGHGLEALKPGSVAPLFGPDSAKSDPATPDPARRAGGAELVIGVGTGFNAAIVHKTGPAPGGARLVYPSECGHAALPLRDADDLRLAAAASHCGGFCAVEDVLSGRGLESVRAWLARESGEAASGRISAAQICAALDGVGAPDPLSVAAARVFTRFLGRVAGDLALVHLPFGGVWLAGGVARALAPHLLDFGLREAFADKGRESGLMAHFPVAMIDDDFAALNGCAIFLDQACGRG